jgi:hypothetical protein
LLTSTFDGKLRNGLDNNLCLTYHFDEAKLLVKACQDGDGDSLPEKQYWDLFDSRLHPGSDMCLQGAGDGSTKYASITMERDLEACTNFQVTSSGKIYTEYDNGTRMYLGVSGSCHTTDIEDRKVELQRFNFADSTSCGQAQQWYVTN